MRKITLSLFFLSLAVLIAAQGKNDRAWLDLNQARTLWMASGGLTMLNASKLYPLREHRLVLFPDTDETGKTFQQWKSVAEAAQEFFKFPIRVSPILEIHATPEQKAAKIDLVDYLFK